MCTHIVHAIRKETTQVKDEWLATVLTPMEEGVAKEKARSVFHLLILCNTSEVNFLHYICYMFCNIRICIIVVITGVLMPHYRSSDAMLLQEF